MFIFRIINKYKKILSRHQKIRIIEMSFLMIIGGFLEMISVSLILPFMSAVMNPEETMGNKYVELVCSSLNISSHREFLMLLALLLAFVYIAKNLFLLFQFNVQNRFVYWNMLHLQNDLLQNFLARPYEFFLYADSGELVRIVHDDTNAVFGLLLNILSLFTELVVSSLLIITTFMAAPFITSIIAIVLLLLLLVISIIIRPRLQKLGIVARDSRSGTYKWLLQTIEGVKEVKVMGREDYFRSSFVRCGTKNINSARRHRILSLTPKLLIEAISMSTMFTIIAVMIGNGTDLKVLVPMLSAVAMAAIRLLPSVNRIASSIGDIAFNEPVLDKMIENLNRYNENKSKEHGVISIDDSASKNKVEINSFEREICFESVTYHYPTIQKNILDNASMTIKRGESIGIVGGSGSGKTTTVDLMLGLLCPQEGRITVDGFDIKSDEKGWLSMIGYIPQMIYMLDDSIRSNVAFGIKESEVDDEKVWEALEEASLKEFVEGLPEKLDTQIGERGVRISGGQRQRIGIARALYKKPSILFFDEATSALDNDTESAIMDSINGLKGKKTMIIIAHRLTTIEKCDKIFKVEEGKIIKCR